ncbi:MAG: hypothetical protein ACQESG_05555 [Nanobdellota archaeon]
MDSIDDLEQKLSEIPGMQSLDEAREHYKPESEPYNGGRSPTRSESHLPQKRARNDILNEACDALYNDTRKTPVVMDKQKSVHSFTGELEKLCQTYNSMVSRKKFPYRLLKRKEGMTEEQVVSEIHNKFHEGSQLIGVLINENERASAGISSSYKSINEQIENYTMKLHERTQYIEEALPIFKEIKQKVNEYSDGGIPEDMEKLKEYHRSAELLIKEQRRLSNYVHESKILAKHIKTYRNHALELQLTAQLTDIQLADLKETAGEIKKIMDYSKYVEPAQENLTLGSAMVRDMYKGLNRFMQINSNLKERHTEKYMSLLSDYNEQKKQNDLKERSDIGRLNQLQEIVNASKPSFQDEYNDFL